MVEARISGGSVSFDCTKFRWDRVGIIEFKRAGRKLHGVIRVVKTFNREHRSTGILYEARVNGSCEMSIQLEQLPNATR